MCLAKCVLSSGAFNKMQLAEKLELPLGTVWKMLQEVDDDLAEFAASMFEQSLYIIDYAVEVTVSDTHLNNLQEKLGFLHEHVLCLIDCTEVVDDHHTILCAGKQNSRETAASRGALKHLHQVDCVLGRLRDDLLKSASETNAISGQWVHALCNT